MLAYDDTTCTLLLLDKTGILVDVSQCIDAWSGSWVREKSSVLMVIGYLEFGQVGRAIQSLQRVQ